MTDYANLAARRELRRILAQREREMGEALARRAGKEFARAECEQCGKKLCGSAAREGLSEYLCTECREARQ